MQTWGDFLPSPWAPRNYPGTGFGDEGGRPSSPAAGAARSARVGPAPHPLGASDNFPELPVPSVSLPSALASGLCFARASTTTLLAPPFPSQPGGSSCLPQSPVHRLSLVLCAVHLSFFLQFNAILSSPPLGALECLLSDVPCETHKPLRFGLLVLFCVFPQRLITTPITTLITQYLSFFRSVPALSPYMFLFCQIVSL